ncbi:MAG: peptidoglycan DD-metalloendopeptidase family protein [Bacteroidia bacterium]|nr:peptidoglycan DD-metalloendopeptidase family protein [Bacteroidia bacterium]
MSMLFLSPLQANTINNFPGGPEDTVSFQNNSIVKQNSIIQSMSKEQLNLLVDFLLELDSIPQDLLNEIKMAVAKLNSTPKSPVEFDKTKFPAADIYASWEINKLFPEVDMLKLKGDTSVTLTLNGAERGDYFHPFNGPITSTFGWRDSAQHNGIDIDLNKGDKVSAAFNGMVRFAKRFGGFGNVVIIRHYNGLETVYAHLWKIKVKPGDIVTAGQLIGLGGSTGHSTGSHLHFEVRFKGVPVNPKYIISLKEQKLLCDQITIKKSKWGLAAYPSNSKQHTVEKGDTIFEIAKRYGTTTASIKQMNGFTTGRVRLKVGQTVTVFQ